MNPLEETKTLETPVGKQKVEFKAYLTGKDIRENRRMLVRLADEGKAKSVDALDESENALISQIVLSVDGNKEGVLDTVLGMHAEDYNFVLENVNDIAQGVSKKKEVI